MEEQQAEGKAEAQVHGMGTSTAKRGTPESAAHARQQQELNLKRERILSERTSSPLRRAALEEALREIESQIAFLGEAGPA